MCEQHVGLFVYSTFKTAPHCNLFSSTPGATNGNTRFLSGCVNIVSILESILSLPDTKGVTYHRGFSVLLSCVLVDFWKVQVFA